MDLKFAGIVGEIVGFVIEWLCLAALFGASVGLIAAYFVATWFGLNQEFVSWAFASIGFAIGFRYDYEELRETGLRSTVAVVGYLGLALFLMSLEVLFVLSCLEVSA